MTEIKEKAYAKLNISLDVTRKREDGYHDMVMVMQTISLSDQLVITLNDSGKINAETNMHFIPGDERNLAVKAAMQYLEAIGESGQGVHIKIDKSIPVGAGMAGGSSNAAAVLRGLNRIYGDRLSRRELETIACNVGSDVPFCVAGGTSLAKGRGEILSDIKPMPDCIFVVCKPEFSVSTPELFRKLDSAPMRRHPDTAGILQAIENGQIKDICRRMYNVFEDVDDRRMRTVSQIKGVMLDHGALGSVMTGTGSAVFGIYTNASAAKDACEALGREYRFCCTAEPIGRLLD